MSSHVLFRPRVLSIAALASLLGGCALDLDDPEGELLGEHPEALIDRSTCDGSLSGRVTPDQPAKLALGEQGRLEGRLFASGDGEGRPLVTFYRADDLDPFRGTLEGKYLTVEGHIGTVAGRYRPLDDERGLMTLTLTLPGGGDDTHVWATFDYDETRQNGWLRGLVGCDARVSTTLGR